MRSSWDALLQGRSGIGPITKFDAANFASRIPGEVRGFDPENYVDRKEAKKMDTFTHYAVAASREASLSDSGFRIDAANADRVGVYIGSGIGGMPIFERTVKEFLERGPRRISPFFIPAMINNLAAGQVSILTGAKGPNLAVATACATGNHAIGESFRLIREGYADAMIAGGTEGSICGLAVGGFCAMKGGEGISRVFRCLGRSWHGCRFSWSRFAWLWVSPSPLAWLWVRRALYWPQEYRRKEQRRTQANESTSFLFS